MYIYTYNIYIYVCVCVCVNVCMYVCIYIYMCVCVGFLKLRDPQVTMGFNTKIAKFGVPPLLWKPPCVCVWKLLFHAESRGPSLSLLVDGQRRGQ